MPAVPGPEPNDIVRTFGYIKHQAMSRRTITKAIRPKATAHSPPGKGTQTSHRPNLVMSGAEAMDRPTLARSMDWVWIAGEQTNETGLRAVRW